MPHALKVSVYLMVWFVAVSLIAFRWFSEFNLPTVSGLGLLSGGCDDIICPLVLFGRKNLSFRLQRNRFGMVKREIALNLTRTCIKVDS